jgi:hypothetical protein
MPGAEESTPLLAVTRHGADGVAIQTITAADLLATWRPA